MHNRIDKQFAGLSREGRKGLVTYLMAGDPDPQTSRAVLAGLPEAGADFIEIGMPFSDPVAEGPIIQAASLRSLTKGTKIRDVFAMMKEFRKRDDVTPLIPMGYYNSVYHYGVEKFCHDMVASGGDGIILVDLPPEEEEEFTSVAKPLGIHLIRLLAPTTDDARLKLLTKEVGGFLYCIAVAGITGTKSATAGDLKERISHIKSRASLPVAVGFGIKTPEQAASMSKICDAVVVGSALVEKIQSGADAAHDYIRSLRKAMDG